MLREIAAEVVLFLSRRDLDKTCGVSKWLDALISQCCEAYPLRPVSGVSLDLRGNGFMAKVIIRWGHHSWVERSFSGMHDAVQCAASFLRHSYVDVLGFGEVRTTTLFPPYWKTFIDAFRSGAARRLRFKGIDFSALDNDAFIVAVGLRGLQSLEVRGNVVPSAFVTDDLLRTSVARGVIRLSFLDNKSDAPYRAVLDFFFPADTARAGQSLDRSSALTETFLTKFFEVSTL